MATRCLGGYGAWLGLLVLALVAGSRADYLVFGGLGAGTPGLWGGEIDRYDMTPNKTDLYTVGYNCALWSDATGSEFLREIYVISASYNLGTTDFLLQLLPIAEQSSSSWQRVTLAAGPLCVGGVSCSRPASLLLLDAEPVNGDVGPFAWYNDELYFIITHQEAAQTTFNPPASENVTSGSAANRTWIELRHSVTCQKRFPFRGGNFDFSDCSTLVAVVFDSVQLANWNESEAMVSGHHMLLVQTSMGPFAFIVLYRAPKEAGTSATEAMLIEVAVATSKVRILHRSAVSLRSAHASAILQVLGSGGVDFLENRLCWSSLEKVWCAWWDSESFTEIVEVGDAPSVQQHCTNGDGEAEAMFSGVAVATTDHPFRPGNLTVYVSCQSSKNASIGGTLFYHVDSGNQFSSVVTSKYGPVNARSLFLPSRADRACPTIAAPPGGSPGPGGTTKGPDGGSPGGGAGASMCCCDIIASTILTIMSTSWIRRSY